MGMSLYVCSQRQRKNMRQKERTGIKQKGNTNPAFHLNRKRTTTRSTPAESPGLQYTTATPYALPSAAVPARALPLPLGPGTGGCCFGIQDEVLRPHHSTLATLVTHTPHMCTSTSSNTTRARTSPGPVPSGWRSRTRPPHQRSRRNVLPQ
jgi:hypothetical protein